MRTDILHHHACCCSTCLTEKILRLDDCEQLLRELYDSYDLDVIKVHKKIRDHFEKWNILGLLI